MTAPKEKETTPRTPKARRVNVFDDQDNEEEAPNAAFTAALELARQATSAPAPTSISQEQVQPVNQISSKPEKQTSSKPDRDSEDYTKVTYRVRNEAADAIEDMKLLLKRKYGFKRIA